MAKTGVRTKHTQRILIPPWVAPISVSPRMSVFLRAPPDNKGKRGQDNILHKSLKPQNNPSRSWAIQEAPAARGSCNFQQLTLMVPEIAGLLATGLEDNAFKIEHGIVFVSPQLQSRRPFRAP